MIWLITLSCASGGLMLYLILKRLPEARSVPREDFLTALKSTEPFFDDYHVLVVRPLIAWWKLVAYPRGLHEAEKLILECRRGVLKTEKHLTHFRDYVRGKRLIHVSGIRKEYWNEIHDYKNDNPGAAGD